MINKRIERMNQKKNFVNQIPFLAHLYVEVKFYSIRLIRFYVSLTKTKSKCKCFKHSRSWYHI